MARAPQAGGLFDPNPANAAEGRNPFDVALRRYYRAPGLFVREVLGVTPDDWQDDALRALGEGQTRISVRSGHGVGKTTFEGWAALWFACTRFPFKSVITAPSSPQLFDVLWAELRAWFQRLPSGWQALWDMTTDRFALKAAPDAAFITARTARADTPETFAGIHSQHVLLIADEASGIHESIFEAGLGLMSTPGAITILAGNPTRASGLFWRTHTLETDRWWTRRVSSLDSPRVDPKFVTEVEQRFGRESNAFRVRVLGEFPLSDSDTFIPANLVDEAMQRPIMGEAQPGRGVWGVDVARFGTDASVLIKRDGDAVREWPRRWRNTDTMALAGAVANEFQRTAEPWRPAAIMVDAIGLGAGVADRLRELDLPAHAINVAELPAVAGQYQRLRDQLWGRSRDWLETRRVSLPNDDQLRSDLTSLRYEFMSDGKLRIEAKNAARSRGIASPDSADAFCLTFADIALVAEQGQRSSWKKPIRRNLRGLP